jgi:hypothetical protein
MKITTAPLKWREAMKPSSLFAIKSLIIFLIGSGTLAINLHAQTDLVETASIPFPFTVGTKSIAPGTYHFILESGPFLLSVVNVKTGDVEMFAVHPEQQRAVAPHGHLIFRKSEGRCFLNEVHYSGTSMFSEVIEQHRVGRIEAKSSSITNSVSVAQRCQE